MNMCDRSESMHTVLLVVVIFIVHVHGTKHFLALFSRLAARSQRQSRLNGMIKIHECVRTYVHVIYGYFVIMCMHSFVNEVVPHAPLLRFGCISIAFLMCGVWG